MNAYLADPRRRRLAILLGISLLAIVIALLALWHREAQTAPPSATAKFLPDFAQRDRQVARIHFASKKGGTFDIVFRPSRGWVVTQRGDFPALWAEVNKTVAIVAGMTIIEPKTARADWLHDIGLDAPSKGGDGVEIVMSDDHGTELAHLIVGKSEDIGDPAGAVGLFVRRPDETQSWLVRAEAEFETSPTDFLDRAVAEIDASSIQSTTIGQPDGSSYEVTRDTKTDPHFKLANLPAGREIASDEAPDGVGNAFAGFTFDDVKPAKDVDFSNPVHVTSRTFDGLSIAVSVIHPGKEYWAEVSATSLSNKPEVAKQARNINARANGWAFKLPDYKGTALTATLESLLKPKGGAKPEESP